MKIFKIYNDSVNIATELQLVSISHKEMKEIVKYEKETGLNFIDNTYSFNYSYDNCLMFSEYDSNDLRKIRKNWIICKNTNIENTVIYYNKDKNISMEEALAFFLVISHISINDIIGIDKLSDNEIEMINTYISIYTPLTDDELKIIEDEDNLRESKSKEDIKKYINSYIDDSADKESLSSLIDDFINDRFEYYQDEYNDMIDEDIYYNIRCDIESIGIDNFINDIKNDRDRRVKVEDNINSIITTNLEYTLEDIKNRVNADINEDWNNKIVIKDINSLCEEEIINAVDNILYSTNIKDITTIDKNIIDKSMSLLCNNDRKLYDDIKKAIIKIARDDYNTILSKDDKITYAILDEFINIWLWLHRIE